MKWDNPSFVEEQVWNWRLADLPRGEMRAMLDRLYNGDPPFDEALAEENNIQINRNDLEGPNLLGNARRQWYQAMLKPGNFFSLTTDYGTRHKRREQGHKVTRHVNRILRQSRPYKEQKRQAGAQVMLHGIGPAIWETRNGVNPKTAPIPSIMVPSETLVDCSNLDRFAVFREWTPAQLWAMTHGAKTDPGWDMEMVESQWKYVSEQIQKQPNATAYQYMPERIEELAKQDLGFWGSDAIPTIDVWDFYFRESDDGNGWYRRVILDWGVTEGVSINIARPKRDYPRGAEGKKDSKKGFLYSSGKRKFASALSEIINIQFGDCSAVAPFTYHAVRSLGWMLWGVCDLENRLHCKFNEAIFEQLMWFFRVAGNADLVRLKKANFMHMGVIPQGVDMIKADQRYKPDAALIEMAFGRNAGIMQKFSSSFTQDFSNSASGKESTATEVMARVNSVNQLVSGMMALAYDYEEDKDREIFRRLFKKNSKDPLAQAVQTACLKDGVPEELIDAEKWDLSEERTLGGGNKTIEMAQVQFLQGIRKNLGPDAQRRVDHIAIESATDDAALAEDLAPLEGQTQISNSMHDAQLATERLMRGLPFIPRPDMVYEDYVKVWLADLQQMVQAAVQNGGMASLDDIKGWANMEQVISQFLQIMSSDPEDKEKVRGYGEELTREMNEVKGFAQRLAQARKQSSKGNGGGGVSPDTIAKVEGERLKTQAKIDNMRVSHAQKTAQRQVQFELEQQRKDRETNAQIRRDAKKEAVGIAGELTRNRMRSLNE